MDEFQYLSGFNNTFESQALPGALPAGQNSPQKAPYDLYPEQLSGTAFTCPRKVNKRSWLYKIRPTVANHSNYETYAQPRFSNDASSFVITPQQLRWKAMEIPQEDTDFIQGISTVGCNGDPSLKVGIAVYRYACNTSMLNRAFYSADGEMLIVPEQGTLTIQTEMGWLKVSPIEIVVIPRGVKFRVIVEGPSRGYISETFQGRFELPDLGPIGANGLANPRDFLAPTAAYEDLECDYTVVCKFGGSLFQYRTTHSIFDVVAWHGDYYPYKYNLTNYNVINTVSFDHPDPSIFTVLTVQTLEPGVAALDFVIFPPRWMVAEHTFRPPYFHRNTMTEFMGNIMGQYDAKEKQFEPGQASLHSCMSGHGPESQVYKKASDVDLQPVRFPDGSMQFMFETCYMLKLAPWAIDDHELDNEYMDCWKGFDKNFNR